MPGDLELVSGQDAEKPGVAQPAETVEKKRVWVGKVYCLVMEMNGGTSVTCGRCQHGESAPGVGEEAVRQCFARMRRNCPEGIGAYYMNAVFETPKAKGQSGPWVFMDADGKVVPDARKKGRTR